jgi:hypothetical protein
MVVALTSALFEKWQRMLLLQQCGPVLCEFASAARHVLSVTVCELTDMASTMLT